MCKDLIWWAGIALIVGLVLAAIRRFFPEFFPWLARLISPTSAFPQHLDARIVERINEADRRVNEAKATLESVRTSMTSAERIAAAAADPTPEMKAAVQRAREDLVKAQDAVDFEERHRHQYLQSPGPLDGGTLSTVLQYLIFSSLAIIVLTSVIHGLFNSPPAGSTPRSMITFLITVVTVGIALILVLSSILSTSDDREKRFAQGKEVLTSLLAVLGTIVGFYLGSSEDQAKSFSFDSVVISQAADLKTNLSTTVRGGKAPYSFTIAFLPAGGVAPVDGRTNVDGVITAQFDPPPNEVAVSSFVITARDDTGKSESKVFTQSVTLKGKPKN